MPGYQRRLEHLNFVELSNWLLEWCYAQTELHYIRRASASFPNQNKETSYDNLAKNWRV